MNYTCPYCGHDTTLTSPNRDDRWQPISIAADHLEYEARIGFYYAAVACPNAKCKKVFLKVALTSSEQDHRANWRQRDTLQIWQLLPESAAKPQPEYIPRAIVEDYYEACRIINRSPKSAAALARRTLQGMIRDFWGISKGRLVDEIDELKDKVNGDTWDAIDAVRSVGNIGAHMEKDVNVIVEIEPEEAELLIGLIEDLFVDWYVTRHDRQERNARLTRLAAEKKADKKKPKSS